MSNVRSVALLAVMAALSLTTLAEGVVAQAGPSPYRTVDGWAKLPAGREMGAVGDVTIDPDGEHVWAVVRCDAGPERFGNECLDSDLDPIIKFDSEGNTVMSFGGGEFIWPHGIDVDPDGNVWVTDGVAVGNTPQGTRGHQVIKFSPDGRVLMRLGTPGVPGGGDSHLNAPADVVVADDGSREVGCSWPIGPTIGSRSSTRRGISSRNGRSSVGRAASSSTITTRFSWPILSPTMSRIRAGRWGSGSETLLPVG
jgi:DNA-binding beta-propeller fold protein YncE